MPSSMPHAALAGNMEAMDWLSSSLLVQRHKLPMHSRQVDFFFGLGRAHVARAVQVKIVLLDLIHAHPSRVAHVVLNNEAYLPLS